MWEISSCGSVVSGASKGQLGFRPVEYTAQLIHVLGVGLRTFTNYRSKRLKLRCRIFEITYVSIAVSR
jgi:hypothetical protein